MNIYVGNLSKTTSKEDLQKAFEKFGAVSAVKIKTDLFTRKPKGFAFVTMISDKEGEAAIEGLNGKKLKGSVLKVSEYRSDTQAWKPGKGHGKNRPF